MFSVSMILVFVLVMIITGGAQLYVKSSFGKYSKIRAKSGLSGAEAARRMLAHAGISHVRIERSQGGDLSDHYDPRTQVIRLSGPVYGENSLAALGVACHEAGHAIQHAKKYAPLMIRNGIVPITSISSGMSEVCIMIGFFLLFSGAAAMGQVIGLIGVAMLGVVFLFQLINLIPEFDASARAKKELVSMGLIDRKTELGGVSTMLNAAAMTYVAGVIAAFLQLAYYAMIFLSNRR
ncbi:MAG: zinc metallopeptidase [Sumerlaeia bacterium]